jgi:hypothetical protein
MFAVEPTPRDDKAWTAKRVIDHGRDVYLQNVSGIGRRMGGAFILVHGEKTIPFEAEWDGGLKDAFTGEPYFLMHFSMFGISGFAGWLFGIEPYEFAGEDEKKEWMRLAAEALVVYGLDYDGLDHKDGYTRVELDGEQLTLSSFGYTSQIFHSSHRNVTPR